MPATLPDRSSGASISTAHGFMAAVQPIMPVLKARARRLTGNATDSEDLVQDTLIRAWRSRGLFEPDTNLRAWLLRIERNSFLSQRRRAGRQVELEPEMLDRLMNEMPGQETALYMGDLDRAIDALPEGQRQAFLSVRAGRYDEVARHLGVAEGTLRSRVARAKAALLVAVDGGMPARSVPALPIPPRRQDASARYVAWKRAGSRMIG